MDLGPDGLREWSRDTLFLQAQCSCFHADGVSVQHLWSRQQDLFQYLRKFEHV